MVPCDRMGLASLDDEIEEMTRGRYLRNGKCRYGEVADYYGDDKSVEIVCQESSFDATDKCIQNHTRRQQEDGGHHWHSGPVLGVSSDKTDILWDWNVHSQRRDGCACAEQHVCHGDNVVDETKCDPDYVRNIAISYSDYFQERVCLWNPHLACDTQHRKKYDHGGTSRTCDQNYGVSTSRTGSYSPSSKPERTRNAIVVSYECTTQHCRTP